MRIYPSKLRGSLTAPASKSATHRHLICASLADGPSRLAIRGVSEDIEATIRCLSALGARIGREGDIVNVSPIKKIPPCPTLDCGESGSTLRFLLPVAAMLGAEAIFTGHGSLPSRPNEPLLSQLRAHGVSVERRELPIALGGQLEAGSFELPGDISSQFVTGLLLALPHLEGPSLLTVATRIESLGYVDLTLSILSEYGVHIRREENVFSIPAPQKLQSGCHNVEGDWSAAAFWLAANALGHRVKVLGLDPRSRQGDREIVSLLKHYEAPEGGLRGFEIDASNIPDLVPILAVLATQAEGATRIYNAGRLRMKESDRLHAMRVGLSELGADIRETENSLLIRGKTPLRGGRVSAFGDHRVAMALTIASATAAAPTIISGAESVAKSYPAFYEDFRALGGTTELTASGAKT